jgi:hypothetical protein
MKPGPLLYVAARSEQNASAIAAMLTPEGERVRYMRIVCPHGARGVPIGSPVVVEHGYHLPTELLFQFAVRDFVVTTARIEI